LAFTLFDRLINELPAKHSQLLKEQYRMNELIMRWSSDAVYGGQLRAAPGVAGHTLRDITNKGA
jgi:superfamily I DNA and/or RNA helicase